MSYPLSFYIHLQLFPIYVTILLLFLLVIVSVACYYKPCCGEKPAKRFLIFLAKITFTPPKGLLGYSAEKDEVYIKKTRVSDEFPLLILGGYAVLFVMMTITVCWEIGIIDETYGNCDTTKMDCFVSTPDEKDVLVVNCSDYAGDDKATVVCFHPIGNVAAVPAVFGGMLSFIQLSMKLISKACLWYYSHEKLLPPEEKKRWSKSLKCLQRLHFVGLALLTVVGSLLIAATLHKLYRILPYAGVLRSIGMAVLVMAALWSTLCIRWQDYYMDVVADGGRTSGKEPPSSDTKKPPDSGGLLLSINTAEEEPDDIPIEPIGGTVVPTIEPDSGGGSDGSKKQESRELTTTGEEETQRAEDTAIPTNSSSGGTPTTMEGLRRRPLPQETDS